MLRTLRFHQALASIALIGAAIACEALAILLMVLHQAWGWLLLVILATGALTVASAVVVWRMRRSVEVIQTITLGLQRLQSGRLPQRVTFPEPEETRDLAEAFNRAAESVRAAISDLEGERNRLAAVLDTMADGVLIVDQDDSITLSNQAARSLLMLPSLNGPAPSPGSRLRDHDLQQVALLCRETGERQRREIRPLRGRRMLSVIATPVRDGAWVEVLITLHDLTPMRLVETTRREFVTNVSHELRSPLASVKAMVETLENGAMADRERALDFLRRIHREVDRMHAMVNDLLELARVESGQAALEQAPLDLAALANEVATSVQQRAQGRGVSVTVEAEESLPQAMGDPGKLRQVMMNLVDNALKFTEPGGRVAIRVLAMPESSMLRVEVRDSGQGIPAEHLPHVFERFYKVDRSRRDGGTGLGLAIANHIVQAHGGTISVESAEGEGSTFSFTVPAA